MPLVVIQTIRGVHRHALRTFSGGVFELNLVSGDEGYPEIKTNL
jgi:hypothetical protein